MTCMDDGNLRARRDGELSHAELVEVDEHLAACADCRGRSEMLSAEASRTAELLSRLAPSNEPGINPAAAYTQFRAEFMTEQPRVSWIDRVLSPRWRPAWGLAMAAALIAIVVGVSPVRSWAQRVLAMLRVQKIAVVALDPNMLMNSGDADSHPYKLINQFLADNVVVTMKAGNPSVVTNLIEAAQLAGYPVRSIGSLGTPQSIRVSGETAFQMKLDRDRIETVLDEVGRSDIRIPESADGALIAVHIPKIAVSMYGDCPVLPSETPDSASQTEAMARRKMEMMRTAKKSNCVYLVQAPSPTVSVPPDLQMSQIAEAALELAGMSSAEAHSFCQTVDWSSTLVVPIPRNTSSYQTVGVDGVEGTLITQSLPEGNRYSLLWVKNGMIESLTGPGSSSDALNLAASLQ